VSRDVDRKANTVGRGGVLERCHGAPLERLAKLGDALSGVSAHGIRCPMILGMTPIIFALVEAAEMVAGQTASTVMEEHVSRHARRTMEVSIA
jgi:hypothetical protein